MKLTIATKIYGGYAIAIVILVFISMTSYKNTQLLLSDSKWVTHSNEVKNEISSILTTLSDIETGQRGYIITGDESYLEPYLTGRDSIFEKIKNLQSLIRDNESQISLTDKLKTRVEDKLRIMEVSVQIRKNKGFTAAATSLLNSGGKQAMDELRKILAEMTSVEDSLFRERTMKTEAIAQKTISNIVWGIPIAVIVLVLVGFLIARNIIRPLKQVTRAAESIAIGDLAVNIIAFRQSDEAGLMLLSFNKMIEMLREQNQEILKGVNVIASTSAEILTSTTQIASGSSQTAAAISETTTTVEEVRQAAQLSSQKAKNLSENANRVSQVSQNGRKAVDETVDGMNQIRKQMDEIAQSVILLSEQSQSIGGIIASVTDLADQSNLLAVNAAIEAAKAGEQGKGFAVVAQEIRNLAEQSKQATLQVRNILNDVQKATRAAVLATEQGNKAVEDGVKKSVQAGEAIRILTETSGEAVQVSTQIVASSQQQLLGMDQIAIAMQSINQSGIESAASMIQAEQALKNLHELGQKLKELVEQFKM
jgi:methyl-accepting chemotaxis protein